MPINRQINMILNARAEKAAMLEQKRKQLTSLQDCLLKRRAELDDQAALIVDEAFRTEYEEIIDAIPFQELLTTIEDVSQRFEHGTKRFQRDYISIATIGKEGQGKSRLLQAIGNLDSKIIPSGDAGSCTGATSIIWNDPELQENEIRCKITFRRPEDLLEMIKPYINTLSSDYLSRHPLDFYTIGTIKVNRLYKSGDIADALRSSAKDHLEKIVSHFSEIRNLFGSAPRVLTDPEDIQRFVAQNNSLPEGDPNREMYYNYLAVERADIYCRFFADTGKIRLVDTVGIGATQFGIEEAMLDTVDNECDAAIVMCKPDNRGVQTSDQELYTSLRNRFQRRDTKQWLFYFVNHHRGHNDNAVALFRNMVLDRNWSVALCNVVDASDQNAVRDQFMLPMLQKLLQNLEEIDRAYLQELSDAEEVLNKQLEAFIDKFPVLQRRGKNSQVGLDAFNKGLECYRNMSVDLLSEVSRWGNLRCQNNGALWNAVQRILNNMERVIPSEEDISRICATNALFGNTAWQTMLHYVRNTITEQFIAIDDVLEVETRLFKNTLVRSVYEELRTIGEDKVPQPDQDDENVDMVEWLKGIMDQYLKDRPEYRQIYKAFDFLYRFEFSTRAQIIQEVRRQLYIINPICTAEYAQPDFNFGNSTTCGKEIHYFLTSRIALIEDELRYHLASLYRSPNMAFYAAAEEFYDRLTHASALESDKLISMASVWGKFFQDFSAELWRADMVRYETVNALTDCYNNLIADLHKYLGRDAVV